ncbi:MAG: superinfection immunity protein [Candidatus Gastranaerophilales bacterium]|nr:superinfection immunity protein [Candidatus Gastranaerophilales bacterium]
MDFGLMIIFIIMFFCAVWLFIALAIYFIPLVVAYIRKHNDILPIAILNILLGWTFFGWLASLLWALNSDVQENEE